MESGTKACSSVAKCQEAAAGACGVRSRAVQWILNEANASIKSCGSAIFKLPGKWHNCKKEVSELDNFDKKILRCILHMYVNSEYPTADKIVFQMKVAENWEF